ncbi:MAG: TonB-dependent receptor [Bacteroidetes bacterium]|nr:TonB-dependent receptor [Bacteroidota bacterium]
MKKHLLSFLVMALPLLAVAQSSLSGKVVSNSGAVASASVSVSPGGKSTITDENGKFSFSLESGSYKVTVSSVGLTTKTVNVTLGANQSKDITVELAEGVTDIQEVVVVGTRTAPRSSTNSPLPVDVFQSSDITSTGQVSFDKALQYRVPSFNTVQTPVNDATSLLDPYEIRNMGPSRTLILINGKRKNMSSLLYVQTSPGRGETGADISAIPTEAIKSVEILRDGASAQYGSDAIAGVMNIVLKDKAEYGTVTINSGITHEGDGESYGVSLNNGKQFGKNGFLNYTVSLSQVDLANRPGKVDARADADDNIGFGAPLATVQSFLSKHPDGGNINGSPKTTAAKFLVNGSVPLEGDESFYFNAAYVYKKVNSYANYRTPYWKSRASNPLLVLLGPNVGLTEGYVPTFEGTMSDYNATVGFKSKLGSWNSDASFTTGGNSIDFDVRNTVNYGLGMASPIEFKPGGFAFNHIVGNLDINKQVASNLSVAFGTEFRAEEFTMRRGDTASYVRGGANSFPGFQLDNKDLRSTRFNIGFYGDLSYDLSKDFLVNATLRSENYSDFGKAFVWKVSSRYKLMDDKLTLRASASTGFRAPSLHQTSLQLSQASFLPGGAIVIEGIINNGSAQAKALGVEKLRAEKSDNITFGFGLKANKDLSVTVDYYSIKVKDRIVLGSKLNTSVGRVSFFTNGITTQTTGFDFVLTQRNIALGRGKLSANLAGNVTLSNELVGGLTGGVKNPAAIAATGQSIFDATQEALLLSSRPATKVIFGLDYKVGKVNFNLNNTYFGKTTFHQDGINQNLNTEFIPKIVTDLGVNINFNKKVNFAFNINNLLNVMPEWKFVGLNSAGTTYIANANNLWEQTNLLTFNGRYSNVTYDGSHFSQLGTLYQATLTFKFY